MKTLRVLGVTAALLAGPAFMGTAAFACDGKEGKKSLACDGKEGKKS